MQIVSNFKNGSGKLRRDGKGVVMFPIIKVRIWEHSIPLRVFKEDAREIWGLLK